jgi:hypothetical protein
MRTLTAPNNSCQIDGIFAVEYIYLITTQSFNLKNTHTLQTINSKAAKRNGRLALIMLLTCIIACIVAYCSDKEVEWEPLPDNIEEFNKDVGIAYA